MKRLLTLDQKNYSEDMPIFEKHTVRAIISRNGLYAMQQSGTGEYKIPGGGVENGESKLDTLKREVLEETGLVLIPESVKEIGEILELREDLFNPGTKYICHSYFYFCDTKDLQGTTHMTESEIEKGFHPVWATLEDIVNTNRSLGEKIVSERDTAFMAMLLDGKI